MATRAAAAAFLAASALVAWITAAVPLAARVLEALVVASMIYVAWLAAHGARVMRDAFRTLRSPASVGESDPQPFVSLVLPARDEAAVVAGTVRSLAAIDYRRPDGTPNYELLVVDDGSTDRTGAVATAAAEGSSHVSVLRREPTATKRTKGAVLAWAMPYLRGEVIGAVDADARVDPSFLGRAMAAWRRDPAADALQVARLPRNASASWLTRAQAEEQMMDLASQCGRWATDGTAELRGNGMFVRRSALEAVGGWSPDALTEDLELSTRLVTNGRHVTLAPEVPIEEEAVERLGALWRQRIRWAEGSLRRLLEHGPRFIAGPQPWGRKLDFLAFAGEFLVPPLFAATIVASLISVVLPMPADWRLPIVLAVGYGLGIFILALAGLHATGERGPALVGRATRGALFLSHWLLVVPVALVRIAAGPSDAGFTQTPRFMEDER